jgi:hypothetical protein
MTFSRNEHQDPPRFSIARSLQDIPTNPRLAGRGKGEGVEGEEGKDS